MESERTPEPQRHGGIETGKWIFGRLLVCSGDRCSGDSVSRHLRGCPRQAQLFGRLSSSRSRATACPKGLDHPYQHSVVVQTVAAPSERTAGQLTVTTP